MKIGMREFRPNAAWPQPRRMSKNGALPPEWGLGRRGKYENRPRTQSTSEGSNGDQAETQRAEE